MDKPFAITLDPGSSRANHTGAWRTERPVYVSLLPPCNNACPAGENIQQWLYHAEEGGLPAYEAAWRQIMNDNPFPAIMGRVCYRPCETACNRAQLDKAVGINSVERYLGDQAVRQGWTMPLAAAPTSNRVTVAHADSGSLTIEKMRLDETGFPQPTGEFEELAADCLVLALGQDADLAVLDGVPGVTFSGGTVDVSPDLMTGHPGIFAGGDMVPAERTVTVAIGHGKKAARAIDTWLRASSDEAAPRHDLATYEGLNTWYYADAPAAVRPKLESARRIGTFDEVTGGLDASTALFEARRCMSCGNCFGCDNCYGACPDNAVIKTGPGGYEIDYDYCKGCGICAAECPCGAIAMVPEGT